MNNKEKLKELFAEYNITGGVLLQKILSIFEGPDELISSDLPVFIGCLNKTFGWNGFEDCEPGTEVWEMKDCYFFNIYSKTAGVPVLKIRYSKETLKPCINFIKDDK